VAHAARAHVRYSVLVTKTAFTLAMLLVSPVAHAQMFVATGRDTLRGLPGVEVAVEVAQPELARRGLDPAAIRADVERRLRAGGVMVYASQAQNPSEAKPYLYVHVNALELPAGAGYAVALQVHVRQTVRSTATSSQIVNAMTWDAHNVVVAPSNGLVAVQEEIDAYVDAFLRDWKAVHP
jgi:hypothetical protein